MPGLARGSLMAGSNCLGGLFPGLACGYFPTARLHRAATSSSGISVIYHGARRYQLLGPRSRSEMPCPWNAGKGGGVLGRRPRRVDRANGLRVRRRVDRSAR